MVLAKGLRSQSRYCWAGRDQVASRSVSALEGLDLTAFVVSFDSAMRQLECKSGVSPRFAARCEHEAEMPPRAAPGDAELLWVHAIHRGIRPDKAHCAMKI